MEYRDDEPKYQIGVAARILQCHPQTLRLYEREGLIAPYRTEAGFRLYRDADLELLRRIQSLTQDLGVNLAGVHVILKLLQQIERLSSEVAELRQRLQEGPRALGPGEASSRPPVRIKVQGADEQEGGGPEP